MSQFENYHETSKNYDRTRIPVGLNIITEGLTRFCAPLDKLTLLDAGCGTGTYTAALLHRVHRIEAFDLNPSMLSIAKQKFSSEKTRSRVRFQLGSIEAPPLQDKTIGAVMVNQVLHHLGDNAHTGWAKLRRVFRQCFRVLKPNGVLVLNSCSHQQLEQGFWFYSLIPDALDQVKRFLPPETVLTELLESTGFEIVDRQVPYEEVLQGERYFEPQGILDPMWRSGDSIWSLVPQPTLKHVLAEVAELLHQDQLVNLMQHADSHRPSVGQTTFTIARVIGGT